MRNFSFLKCDKSYQKVWFSESFRKPHFYVRFFAFQNEKFRICNIRSVIFLQIIILVRWIHISHIILIISNEYYYTTNNDYFNPRNMNIRPATYRYPTHNKYHYFSKIIQIKQKRILLYFTA